MNATYADHDPLLDAILGNFAPGNEINPHAETLLQALQDRAGSAQTREPDSARPHHYHLRTNTWTNKKDSLPLGVYRWKGCSGYVAKFENRYLGTFDTPEDASAAYWKARAEADGPKDAA
jgi:hypothetical protein